MSCRSRRSVIARRHRGCLHIRLTRSDRHNALDRSTLEALEAALETAASRPAVLVLEGDGGLFSVGPDIAELAELDQEAATDFSRLAHRVVARIEAWPRPTVALLEGLCLGMALELALACDVLVGSDDLRLGLPGLVWAMVPCMGGLRRLALRTSAETAARLFLQGETLHGADALTHGLLDRIVSDPYEVDALVADLREYSPCAVAAIRSLRLDRLGPQDGEAEAALFAQPFATGECQRRLRSLLAG